MDEASCHVFEDLPLWETMRQQLRDRYCISAPQHHKDAFLRWKGTREALNVDRIFFFSSPPHRVPWRHMAERCETAGLREGNQSNAKQTASVPRSVCLTLTPARVHVLHIRRLRRTVTALCGYELISQRLKVKGMVRQIIGKFGRSNAPKKDSWILSWILIFGWSISLTRLVLCHKMWLIGLRLLFATVGRGWLHQCNSSSISLSLSLSVRSQSTFLITGPPLILLVHITHYHLHLRFRPRKWTKHPQHPTNSSKSTGQSGCGRNTPGCISRNATKWRLQPTNTP